MTVWLVSVLVLGGMASLAIWSRRPTRMRGLSVAAFVLSMPVVGAVLIANGGWAVVPVPHLSGIPSDGDVLGVMLVQDVAIYVMLDVGGEPRMFSLPWSNKRASELQRMMERGDGGKIRAKKGKSEDDYPVEFHDEPQPDNPPKAAQPAAPHFEAPV